MRTEGGAWQISLRGFFEERGRQIEGRPSLDDLCYVAGRDPRLWRGEAIRNDLADSIVALLGADDRSSILEVGSAAGFLAMLVAPRVGRFTGLDLSGGALAVARRLGLPNASFRRGDGAKLPFGDESFDGAFCYDVFTNLPSIADGRPLIAEMLRVVRRGGRVLVGSIPDGARADEYAERVSAVGEELFRTYGPPIVRPTIMDRRVQPIRGRIRQLFRRPSPAPAIVTYDFLREDFLALGLALGANVDIMEIHSLNPYFGLRFNAVFSRP